MENKFVSMNWQFKFHSIFAVVLGVFICCWLLFRFLLHERGPCIKNVKGIFIGLHLYRQNCCIPFSVFQWWLLHSTMRFIFLFHSLYADSLLVIYLTNSNQSKFTMFYLESVLDERNQKKCSGFVPNKKISYLHTLCGISKSFFR